MLAGPLSAAGGAPPLPGGAGNAAEDAFIIRMTPICPATGSATGILNVVGPSTALFQSPSPTARTFDCSVNFAFGAIGAFDGSCATSAARYRSAIPVRHT